MTANTCLGTTAKVQAKMGAFFAGLAGRADEVQSCCRTKLQALAEALPAPLTEPDHDVPHVDFIARQFRALASGGDRFMPPADQDVRDAVTFLASRAVGILRLVDPDTAGYRLTMSALTARQRLKALEATIRGGLEPRSTGSVVGKLIGHTP